MERRGFALETCIRSVIFRITNDSLLQQLFTIICIKDWSSGAPLTLFVYAHVTTDAYPRLLLKVQLFLTVWQWNIQISLWLFCDSLLVRDYFIWNCWNSQYTLLFNIKVKKFGKNFHSSWNSAAQRACLPKFCIITNMTVHFFFTPWRTTSKYLLDPRCRMCNVISAEAYYLLQMQPLPPLLCNCLTCIQPQPAPLLYTLYIQECMQSKHRRWFCCCGLFKGRYEDAYVSSSNKQYL